MLSDTPDLDGAWPAQLHCTVNYGSLQVDSLFWIIKSSCSQAALLSMSLTPLYSLLYPVHFSRQYTLKKPSYCKKRKMPVLIINLLQKGKEEKWQRIVWVFFQKPVIPTISYQEANKNT